MVRSKEVPQMSMSYGCGEAPRKEAPKLLAAKIPLPLIQPPQQLKRPAAVKLRKEAPKKSAPKKELPPSKPVQQLKRPAELKLRKEAPKKLAAKKELPPIPPLQQQLKRPVMKQKVSKQATPKRSIFTRAAASKPQQKQCAPAPSANIVPAAPITSAAAIQIPVTTCQQCNEKQKVIDELRRSEEKWKTIAKSSTQFAADLQQSAFINLSP